MKKIICLLTLSTLIACNGKSNSSGGTTLSPFKVPTVTNPLSPLTLEQKKELLAKIKQNAAKKVGSSSHTAYTGSQFDSQKTYEKGTAVLYNQNEKETEIVLKVDGDDVYTYNTEDDLVAGTKNISVYLDKDVPNTDEELEKIKVTLIGDMVNFSTQMKVEEFGTQFNIGISSYLLLSSPCNTSSQFTIGAFEFLSSQGNVSVAAHINKSQSSCGKVFTTAELKKLDLRNVLFCNVKDGRACEMKDMSFLIDEI